MTGKAARGASPGPAVAAPGVLGPFLGDERAIKKGYPRRISGGKLYWIAAIRKNNRYGADCSLRRLRCIGAAGSGNHGDLSSHKISCEHRKTFIVTL